MYPFDHFDKREVLEALRAQRARTLTLLEQLDEPRWEQIVVPGWRVREVVAHLITTDEGALTGRMLRLGFSRRPMSEVEAWNETQVGRWADRPVPALLAGLERWGARMARILSWQPSRAAERKIPTPFGRVSLLWLAQLRVYDEWVHAEDVRRALGEPSDDAVPSVLPVARQLLAAIPAQTLDGIPATATGTVSLAFDDLELPEVGFDLGARRYGTAVSQALSHITGRAPALIMVAAGRDAWRDVEASGGLSLSGDRAPAEVFLDALRVV